MPNETFLVTLKRLKFNENLVRNFHELKLLNVLKNISEENKMRSQQPFKCSHIHVYNVYCNMPTYF